MPPGGSPALRLTHIPSGLNKVAGNGSESNIKAVETHSTHEDPVCDPDPLVRPVPDAGIVV